jgi:hypothetical protein
MVATTRGKKRSSSNFDTTQKQEIQQRGGDGSNEAPGAVVCGNKIINTHGIVAVRIETVDNHGSDADRSSDPVDPDKRDSGRGMHAAGDVYNNCIINHHYYYADDSGVFVEGSPPTKRRAE